MHCVPGAFWVWDPNGHGRLILILRMDQTSNISWPFCFRLFGRVSEVFTLKLRCTHIAAFSLHNSWRCNNIGWTSRPHHPNKHPSPPFFAALLVPPTPVPNPSFHPPSTICLTSPVNNLSPPLFFSRFSRSLHYMSPDVRP